jgi:hypothetical protein
MNTSPQWLVSMMRALGISNISVLGTGRRAKCVSTQCSSFARNWLHIGIAISTDHGGSEWAGLPDEAKTTAMQTDRSTHRFIDIAICCNATLPHVQIHYA